MKDKVFPEKGGTIDFSRFTYSQNHHIFLFTKHNYELELYGKIIDPTMWPLKRYQDLLVFSFITQVIPEGSRILEVGGGDSRIIAYFKGKYECWNIDPLEGLGQGPTQIDSAGFHLLRDCIGKFSPELPDEYFDFVFSISALEHVPDKDPLWLREILTDLDRVLKPNCYSLHCFDATLKAHKMWANKLLLYLFENEKTLNRPVSFSELVAAKDLFVLSESFYNQNWFLRHQKAYSKYGRPFSFNILWRKDGPLLAGQ